MIPVSTAVLRDRANSMAKWRVKFRIGDINLAIHKAAFIVAPMLVARECVEVNHHKISVDVRRLPLACSRLTDLVVSMAVHEAGHAVACQIVGAPIYEIGILPVGAYVAFEPIDLETGQKQLVFASGPIASLILGLVAAALIGRARNNMESDRLVNMAQLNLNAALYNLVPLVITDGGQMLDEALTRCGFDRRTRLLFGMWAGIFMLAGLAKLNCKDRLEDALLSQCRYPPISYYIFPA